MVDRFKVDYETQKNYLLRSTQKEYVRKQKEILNSQGYIYGLSFYGSIINIETDNTEYRRIEILAPQKYTELDIHRLKYFFNYIIPVYEYTLWIYNTRKKLQRIYPTMDLERE